MTNFELRMFVMMDLFILRLSLFVNRLFKFKSMDVPQQGYYGLRLNMEN